MVAVEPLVIWAVPFYRQERHRDRLTPPLVTGLEDLLTSHEQPHEAFPPNRAGNAGADERAEAQTADDTGPDALFPEDVIYAELSCGKPDGRDLLPELPVIPEALLVKQEIGADTGAAGRLIESFTHSRECLVKLSGAHRLIIEHVRSDDKGESDGITSARTLPILRAVLSIRAILPCARPSPLLGHVRVASPNEYLEFPVAMPDLFRGWFEVLVTIASQEL